MDAQGNSTAVWVRHDGTSWRTQSASRPATGSFGGAQTVSHAGYNVLGAPGIAVDPSGNAAATWSEHDGTNYRIRTASKVAKQEFGGGQTISDVGHSATHPVLSIEPGGKTTVLWNRWDGYRWNAESSVRPAGGAFGSPQPVSSYQEPVATVATGRGGDAIAIWQRPDGIRAAFRRAGGAFGAIETVAGPEFAFGDVAVDELGNTVVVLESNGLIVSTYRPADGGFGATKEVSDPALVSFAPRVAISARRAVAVWSTYAGSSYRIDGATLDAGTRSGGPAAVSDGKGLAQAAEVAIDPEGNAIAVWSQYGTGGICVEAAVQSAGASFGPPTKLSDSAGDAHSPTVATGKTGAAIATWSRHDSTGWRIEAASLTS
jgi:hypothetical protein